MFVVMLSGSQKQRARTGAEASILKMGFIRIELFSALVVVIDFIHIQYSVQHVMTLAMAAHSMPRAQRGYSLKRMLRIGTCMFCLSIRLLRQILFHSIYANQFFLLRFRSIPRKQSTVDTQTQLLHRTQTAITIERES